MMEHDRLGVARTPVLVEDLGAVLGFYVSAAHVGISIATRWGISLGPCRRGKAGGRSDGGGSGYDGATGKIEVQNGHVALACVWVRGRDSPAAGLQSIEQWDCSSREWDAEVELTAMRETMVSEAVMVDGYAMPGDQGSIRRFVRMGRIGCCCWTARPASAGMMRRRELENDEKPRSHGTEARWQVFGRRSGAYRRQQ